MVIQSRPLRELALFAGAGGGILGGHLLGWRTVCAVERDAYAASVLIARQNDEILPFFPIWSDVTTFDGRPWRGRVDVISGGFPCQDISAAGKGAGIDGKRSGLWGEFARIIGEVRPRYVFVENSPMLTSRGLGRVLGDLASRGYDARWCVLGADDVGAPHVRKRIWILAECANAKRQVAHSNLRGHIHKQSEIKPAEAEFDALGDVIPSSDDLGNPDHNGCFATEINQSTKKGSYPRPPNEVKARQSARPSIEYGKLGGYNPLDWRCSSDGNPNENSSEIGQVAYAMRERCDQVEQYDSRGTSSEGAICAPMQRSFDRRQSSWWQTEPQLGRVADGVAHRVDRIRAIGNGQVSAVAATAWNILSRGFTK